MELAEVSCQCNEVLAGGVVQVPGDFPSLFVLQAQKLPRKSPQFLFRALALGDIGGEDGQALGSGVETVLPPSVRDGPIQYQ